MTRGSCLQSCLYVGSVFHRRLIPKPHRFRYRLFWLLIDLEELDDLDRRLKVFSHNRFNLFSLFDRDHGDGGASSLRAQAQRLLAAHGIDTGGGPIRLLCMPRMLGYGFNPISVYFCSRAQGALAALIYQVHNTFGERHSYVLPVTDAGRSVRQACAKQSVSADGAALRIPCDAAGRHPDARHSRERPGRSRVARGAGRRAARTDGRRAHEGGLIGAAGGDEDHGCDPLGGAAPLGEGRGLPGARPQARFRA
jgi:hypothetical protein